MSLLEKLRQQEEEKRKKPITPIASSYSPVSIKLLTDPASVPIPKTTTQLNLEKGAADRARGVTISQGTPDPVQQARQSLSKIPVIGKYLTGTGPQSAADSLYPQGSMRQSLVENGIVGFMLEGFQKKVNPTRKEVGEQIFTRYEKLADVEPDENKRLNLAVQDVINQSKDIPRVGVTGKSEAAPNVQALKEPGVQLSKREKDALFWTNLLEDTFAVLDAPIFVGSTKVPKDALLKFLKEADNIDEIVPRLRMIGFSDDVAKETAQKIARSKNEIQIAKIIEDTKKAITGTDTKTGSLFNKIAERVNAEKAVSEQIPTEAAVKTEAPVIEKAAPIVKRVDEVTPGTPEKYFRSAQAGQSFEEIPANQVVPAPIRAGLDTFITKEGDQFVVVEGRTGQQIGEAAPTVNAALQSAKAEISNLPEGRIDDLVNNGPLSPRYTQIESPTPTNQQMPETLPKGVITADQLRLTDKAAARRLDKLERMAATAPTVDKFVDNSGLSRAAMDRTVQEKGYKNSADFFEKNGPKKVEPRATNTTKPVSEPDTRVAPNDEEVYSLMSEQYAGDEFVVKAAERETDTVVNNLERIFADMQGIKLDDVKKFTEEDVWQYEENYKIMLDALIDDPARELMKYVSKTTGRLPEVTGKETMMDLRKGNKVVKNSEFGRRGDEILQEVFGYERQMTREEAQKLVDSYIARRAAVKEVYTELTRIKKSIREAKKLGKFVGENQKKLAKELTTNQTALANLVKAAEQSGFNRGFTKGENKYTELVHRLRERRGKIRAIQEVYNLTDAELREATGSADPRFMDAKEFDQYLNSVEEVASDFQARRTERGIVRAIEKEKMLKNTENLREAMKLPPLSEMTTDQLRKFSKVLDKYQEGDQFLSKRTLEVIDRTAMKGARTRREVRDHVAQEVERITGREVKPSELTDIVSDQSDLLRYDTALAEKNPFYNYAVTRVQTNIMEGEAKFLMIQEEINKLAKAANKSRKQKGIVAKVKNMLAPTNRNIINYLEARGVDRERYAKALTKEELKLAEFMRRYFNNAYSYLSYIEEISGGRYKDAYYTHMRKGFWERWFTDGPEGGLAKAVKGLWDQQKEDMAIANIIDAKTGQVLPKSKFFQFALKRTGEGEVSENAVQVFLKYAQMFERKKMLDKLVPEIDVAVQSLKPQEMTQRGLAINDTLHEFWKNYLNNKRGRRFNFGGAIRQNDKWDVGMRIGNSLMTLWDLGFSPIAAIAAPFGEAVSTFISLGNRKTFLGVKRRIWDTGMKRMVNKNAKSILDQAAPFIGRNIWEEMAEVNKPIVDKAMLTAIGYFGQATAEANKIMLLGSLTKQELKTGKISAERMAQLRLEAGRWRDMGRDVKSVIGSTSLGSTLTKYKGWAIPHFRTTLKNLTTISKMSAKGDIKQVAKSREFRELMRQMELAAVVLTVGNMIHAEDLDDSFAGRLTKRVYQDALSFVSGIDPNTFLTMPRLISFVSQFAGNVKELLLLERYEKDSKYGDKGDLKGLGGFKQQLTPSTLRPLVEKPTGKDKEKQTLDSTTNLGNLDNLDKLNRLDRLDRLDRINSLDSL